MAFIWSTALKDLRRRVRDPVGMLMWVVIPFAVLTLLLLALGSGDTKPQAHLLVEDQDDSVLSGLLLGAFNQGELSEIIKIEKVEFGSGLERIQKGRGSALLVIPPGFGAAVLASEATALTLRTNPSQQILPAIVEEVLSIVTDAAFYLQLTLGGQLGQISDSLSSGSAPASAGMLTMGAKFAQVATLLSEHLNPPLIALEIVGDDEKESEGLRFAPLYFQSMFFMSLVFMASGFAEDLWIEREMGTLRRALAAPEPMWKLLAGKYLAATVVFGVVAALVLPVGAWIFGFELARVPGAAAWIALSGALLYALFSTIQLFASTHKGAGLLANLILFPLLMVGGSFFPFEAMPGWLAAIGRWAPNGWALVQFKAILGGTAEAPQVMKALGFLVVILLAAFALGAARLERRFARSR